MATSRLRVRALTRALTLALILSTTLPGLAATQDPGWPREMTRDDANLVYYQPQIDDWKDFKEVSGRMAISITPRGGKQYVGIVSIQMHTDVDVDSRTALLSNPQITATNFPGTDPERAKNLDHLVHEFLNPQASVTISVDRLVASVDNRRKPPVAAIRNDPPAIFVSFGPAILLFVDGDPVLAPIQKSDLAFVVNASWPLFVDNASHQYYLFTGQSWMTSTDLKTGWTETKTLPPKMSKVPADPTWADLKPYIPPPAKPSTKSPAVFVSNTPAELVVFRGQPVYTAIPGTQLVFAKNTDSDVFVYSPNKTYYYLTAGRWFSSPGPSGPWTFATNQLPTDFAKIPPSSPASRVLASVPGTPEAEDAVLLAQIPTTVEVNPTAAAAAVKVAYSGEPQFAPIEGTPLSYAVNSPDKIVKVQNRYYVCSQGVWFDAPSPTGPWQTTTSVPQVIYTIPPSSPVYNVTYVTQQVTPAGSVQATYTAGYLGVFIAGAAVGAIVAQGNGYYYPPYVAVGRGPYPVYYPRPAPYGYPAYNPYTGAIGVRGSAYGPAGSAQWGASYNPYTGTYARGATASGRYGSASVAQAYNPYTGAYSATRQGSNAYGQWGSSVVTKGNQWAVTQHSTTAKGSVGSYQSSTGTKAVASKSAYGNAAVAKSGNGDVYAGRDGNVYKNTNGSWKKYDNGSWSAVNKPTPQQTQQRSQSAQRQSTNDAANTAAAQQKAQSHQQQLQPRATPPATNDRAAAYSHSFAGASNRASAQSSAGDLNREMQNRQRGASQSQRLLAQSGGRAGGGGGRAVRR